MINIDLNSWNTDIIILVLDLRYFLDYSWNPNPKLNVKEPSLPLLYLDAREHYDAMVCA